MGLTVERVLWYVTLEKLLELASVAHGLDDELLGKVREVVLGDVVLLEDDCIPTLHFPASLTQKSINRNYIRESEYLFSKLGQLRDLLGGQEQQSSSTGHVNGMKGLLNAGGQVISDCVNEGVDEPCVIGGWDLLPGQDNPVIGALDKALLQLDGELDVDVVNVDPGGRVDPLQEDVEFGNLITNQQAQQVQTKEHIGIGILSRLQGLGLIKVKREQEGYVSLKSSLVLHSNRGESPNLIDYLGLALDLSVKLCSSQLDHGLGQQLLALSPVLAGVVALEKVQIKGHPDADRLGVLIYF